MTDRVGCPSDDISPENEVFGTRRKRRESRPNRKGAACVQCGIVPTLRMQKRVCPDCADVNALNAHTLEPVRSRRAAYDRAYYAAHRELILAWQRMAWYGSAKYRERQARKAA